MTVPSGTPSISAKMEGPCEVPSKVTFKCLPYVLAIFINLRSLVFNPEAMS